MLCISRLRISEIYEYLGVIIVKMLRIVGLMKIFTILTKIAFNIDNRIKSIIGKCNN